MFERILAKFRFKNKKPDPKRVISIKTAAEMLDPAWAGDASFTYNENDSGDAALSASNWVYSCADLIAVLFSSIELAAYDGDTEVPSDDKLARLLAQPVPGLSQSLWLYIISMYLTLGGETYLEKVRVPILGKSALYPALDLIKELWPSAGSTFKPVVPKNVRRIKPTAYTPTVGDTEDVLPLDIIHLRKPRPSNINAGFGPVEASQGEINTDTQASAWQQTALKNRGVPDGIFVFKGEDGLEKYQQTAFNTQIKEAWTGLQNAHLPFVLGREVEWIALAKTMVELELLPGRIFTKEAICAAMHTPTVLFDSSGATYANLGSAMLQLLTMVIIPAIKMLVDLLNIMLAPEYGPNISIRYKLTSLMAMMPLIEHQWRVASMAMATGVPMDQILKSVGLDVEPYAGGTKGWIAAGLQDVDMFDIEGLHDTLPSARSSINDARKRLKEKNGSDNPK